MKWKKIAKTTGAVFICAVAVGILWSRTHMEYEETQTVSGSGQDGQAVTVSFPESVQETISDGLSYDAEIIVSEDFNPDELYKSSAVLFTPDAGIWENFFSVEGDAWEISEGEFAARDGSLTSGVVCQRTNEDVLYVSQATLFSAHEIMPYIFITFDCNLYSPTFNMNLFSQESDLAFCSREDNWKELQKSLEVLGLNAQDLCIMSEYSLDAETLAGQEELIAEWGNISEEEKKTSWSEADEGYYYFIEQETQGLPVYKDAVLQPILIDEERTAIEIYASASGISYLSARYLFEFQTIDEKMTLLPIETIMKTINSKYEDAVLQEPLIVRKLELMAYPLETAENEYTVIPVWVCTIARQCVDNNGNSYDQNIYLPVNAVTGEEVFEMEG